MSETRTSDKKDDAFELEDKGIIPIFDEITPATSKRVIGDLLYNEINDKSFEHLIFIINSGVVI